MIAFRSLPILILSCSVVFVSGCGSSSSSSVLPADNDALLNELLGGLDSSPESGDAKSDADADTDLGETVGEDQQMAAMESAPAMSAGPAQQTAGGITSLQIPNYNSAPSATANYAAAPTPDIAAPGTTASNYSLPESNNAGPAQQPVAELTVGERFPIQKTVRQTLVQKSAQQPGNATSELQTEMVIQVEEVTPQACLMSVHYSRVVYSQDVNGQRMTFDSNAAGPSIPNALLPYAGMVNNGFGFRLSLVDRSRQLVGYDEFLQRCVQRVPAERQATLLAELRARFGDDGLADFVDETVGLLPFNQQSGLDASNRVAAGDVWNRTRELSFPVPLRMESTFRLLTLNQSTAEIQINGQMTSAGGAAEVGGQSLVEVVSGESRGTCTIDRRTGLPVKVDRSRYLKMTVTNPDGATVQQDKHIETIIRSPQAAPANQRPVVSGPPAMQQPMGQISAAGRPAPPQQQRQQPSVKRPVPSPGTGIQQVGGTQMPPAVADRLQRAAVSPPADIANLPSTAQAVYPD